MQGVDAGFAVLAGIAHELTLFAVFGFLIGGVGDVAVDTIWLVRSAWRRLTVYRTHPRACIDTIGRCEHPGRIVFFVPAWDESTVIAAMLRHAVVALGAGDWRIYVGVYPNDPATRAAVASVADDRIVSVVGTVAGPTTKAHCLNSLWARLCTDEHRDGERVKAVVLHDAEDVVHPCEVRLFDRMIERFDLVQIPVLPLVDPKSRWIAGHYLDEFAEGHSKTMPLREAIGASIPSAGVGCAFARELLERIAAGRPGPFDGDSLTEDYELGLRVAELGGRGAFVRLPAIPGGPPIAVRAHFPATLSTAVRQKSRWIAGIALSGWDRLGWHGGFTEGWMRMHDRRAVFAAIVLVAGYAAAVLTLLLEGSRAAFGIEPGVEVGPGLELALTATALLLMWRLVLRAVLVTRLYGWREGLRAVPRALVSNVIAIMAARRALGVYLRFRRDGRVRWEKTAHQFPTDPAGAT